MPKLFGPLRERYMSREGGYTRVVRTEPKNIYDQGESAILEFVDGAKDSKFMLTAKTIARDALLGRQPTPLTLVNMRKVTKFRSKEELAEMAGRFLVRESEKAESTDSSTIPANKLDEIIALI